MTNPLYNPGQPYLLSVPTGFSPGRVAHLTGTFNTSATSLILKIQSGPYGDPTDEIGLCIYGRLNEGILGMNAFTRAGGWGQEMALPYQGFVRGQPFELTILCDPYNFKVAANRQHLGEFSHHLDPSSLSHVNVVSGSNDLIVNCIWIEDPSSAQSTAPPGQAPYQSPPVGGPVPYPTPVGQQSYPPQNASFPHGTHSGGKSSKGLMGKVESAGAAVAGALGASHLLGKSKGYSNHGGGYPGGQPQYGGYPGGQPQYGGYPGGQPQYGGYPSGQPQYGGYPGGQPQHGGYPGGHKGSGGIMNKALALGGGLLGAKAVSKGVGGLGGSKALKYGLPIAGAGAGAYMLSKGMQKSFSFDDSFSDSD